MKLVVAEKVIAGKRIAELLADSKPKEKKIKGIPVWEFTRDGQEWAVLPLRGHVVDVDFPKKYRTWFHATIKALLDAPVEYKVSLEGIPAANSSSQRSGPPLCLLNFSNMTFLPSGAAANP